MYTFDYYAFLMSKMFRNLLVAKLLSESLNIQKAYPNFIILISITCSSYY